MWNSTFTIRFSVLPDPSTGDIACVNVRVVRHIAVIKNGWRHYGDNTIICMISRRRIEHSVRYNFITAGVLWYNFVTRGDGDRVPGPVVTVAPFPPFPRIRVGGGRFLRIVRRDIYRAHGKKNKKYDNTIEFECRGQYGTGQMNINTNVIKSARKKKIYSSIQTAMKAPSVLFSRLYTHCRDSSRSSKLDEHFDINSKFV